MKDLFYIYKDNLYRLISEGKMKNPQTGEWEPCVIYMGRDGVTYVREVRDFHSKFKASK